MKLKYLFLLSLIGILPIHAQCTAPPPPGYNPVYSVDLDNDGYTSFDIAYYVAHTERPIMEEAFGVSSSGYDFIFYNGLQQPSALNYTNVMLGEFASIHYQYNGSGPIFPPQPPCYWQVPTEGAIKLVAIPFNEDMDGDGILNADEDSNHNINLMDDDDDNDGIINLEDNSSLALSDLAAFHLKVYPNPVCNGVVTFESDVAITAVTVYDLAGKELLSGEIRSNSLKVDMLASGLYLLKVQSGKGLVFTKIVIE